MHSCSFPLLSSKILSIQSGLRSKRCMTWLLNYRSIMSTSCPCGKKKKYHFTVIKSSKLANFNYFTLISFQILNPSLRWDFQILCKYTEPVNLHSWNSMKCEKSVDNISIKTNFQNSNIWSLKVRIILTPDPHVMTLPVEEWEAVNLEAILMVIRLDILHNRD